MTQKDVRSIYEMMIDAYAFIHLLYIYIYVALFFTVADIIKSEEKILSG